MAYERHSVYVAICEKQLDIDCRKKGPIADSIEQCFLFAVEDTWKTIGYRQVICPYCVLYMRNMKGVKSLNAGISC